MEKNAAARLGEAGGLVPGQNPDHAGEPGGRGRLQGNDPRVRVGTPHKRHMKHPLELEIVNELPAAGEEARIVRSLHPGADVPVSHADPRLASTRSP